MSFLDWIKKELKDAHPSMYGINFMNDIVKQKSISTRIKTIAQFRSYLKRLKYSRVMTAQGVVLFKQWKDKMNAPIDGFGPKDKERIRKATREVWSWSYPRKLCVKRSMGKDGFPRCENPQCVSRGQPVPRIHVDHIIQVGKVDEGYLERLFCPSDQLQALCEKCHAIKTRVESSGVKSDTRKRKQFCDLY